MIAGFFYERLEKPVVVARKLGPQQVHFLIEAPRADCVHACTVDDVLDLMAMVPPDHRSDVDTIVFRQPTRSKYRRAGLLPFPRIVDWEQMGRDGLNPAWFDA